MGKFGQSIRRIVLDVKKEGIVTGKTKDELIEVNERLRAVRPRLEDSYDTAKKALVLLMSKYNDSKPVRNIFQRFNILKAMIKDVIRLETEYWKLVNIPKQEKHEHVPAYVLRATMIMEKTQKSGESRLPTSSKQTEEATEKRARIDKLEAMEPANIDTLNLQVINDLNRLIKKYSGLRNLIRKLKVKYEHSKMFPMILRYSMLKRMIKRILLHPDYMEVCHEVTV